MRDGALSDRATIDEARGGGPSVTARRVTVGRVTVGRVTGARHRHRTDRPTDRRGSIRAWHRPEDQRRGANPKTRPDERADRNQQRLQSAGSLDPAGPADVSVSPLIH